MYVIMTLHGRQVGDVVWWSPDAGDLPWADYEVCVMTLCLSVCLPHSL